VYFFSQHSEDSQYLETSELDFFLITTVPTVPFCVHFL
jgi:hypothetical protein